MLGLWGYSKQSSSVKQMSLQASWVYGFTGSRHHGSTLAQSYNPTGSMYPNRRYFGPEVPK